ncbi:MAG: amidase [Pseudomonadales bacterium]
MNEFTRRHIVKTGLITAGAVMAGPSIAIGRGHGLSFEEYRGYDALGLAQLVKDKGVSALELLEVAIARAEEVNPSINCMVEKLYDRARAEASQQLPEGPFSGVPFLLKDLGMALKGTVTTNGSRLYKDARLDYTSTVVERYQRAGLVIFGKTASPEFGGTGTTESILFGDTRNPWDLSRSAGGSSGGSAAAVAAGVLPIANGTDGGGSIRIPASCCGLFGLKPSRGRVPRGPKQLSSTMSVTHAITRSVRDSAALLDATHGPELGQTQIAPSYNGRFLDAIQQAPKPLRIGLVTEAITRSPVDKECLQAVNDTAKLCESLGHRVDPVTLPVDPREFFTAVTFVSGAGTVSRVQTRERQLGRKATESDLEPVIWQRYQEALTHTSEQLFNALATLEKIGRQIATLQLEYDVLLSPTLAKPPVEIGKLSLNQDNELYKREAIYVSAFTMLYNATGQPAMSVPLHWTRSGLPVGVMFAGRFGEEQTLLQLAAQLEQAKPWFDKLAPKIT